MATPVTELTDRARAVFRLVVESYLDHGQPVGSRTLSKLSALNLSPASIRNVMQDLQDCGLLAAPHTSAGRVPTESGLRLFVDAMMQASEPSAEERALIERGVPHGAPVADALAATTQALAGLAHCAGMVMVPARETRLRQFAFTPLSPGQALAVLVGEDGGIENRVIAVPRDLAGEALNAAGRYMTERFAGMTLAQAQARLAADLKAGRDALDGAARSLVDAGIAIWSTDAAQRPVLIVRGAAHLIDAAAAADLDRVRLLLDEIEGQEEIARLLDSARDGAATKVFIGAENRLFALSGSSVIAAPYRGADGQVIGVVGVIGPTRLNYARVVPIVDFTAQTLTRLLT